MMIDAKAFRGADRISEAIIVICFFAFFIITLAYILLVPDPKIGLLNKVILTLLVSGISPVLIFWILKAWESTSTIYTVDENEIIKRVDNVVVSRLRWDEFMILREVRIQHQLVLENEFKNKKLVVEFKTDGFENLGDIIYRKYEERMATLTLPTFCQDTGALFRQFSNAFVRGGLFIVVSILAMRQNPHSNIGIFCLVISSCMLLWVSFQAATRIYKIKINENGIVFKSFVEEKQISYKEINSIILDEVDRYGDAWTFVTVVLSDRTTLKLTRIIGQIPYIYTLLTLAVKRTQK